MFVGTKVGVDVGVNVDARQETENRTRSEVKRRTGSVETSLHSLKWGEWVFSCLFVGCVCLAHSRIQNHSYELINKEYLNKNI